MPNTKPFTVWAKPAFQLEITNLITPHLLHSIFTLEIPWPKGSPPTAKEWSTKREKSDEYKTLCWDILIAFSKISLLEVQTSDFLTLLPTPADPSFPEQAVGLLLLLDQAPRHLCNNVNERWRNGFFDPLAFQYSLALRNLPQDTQIHTFPRWKELGWSYEHFCAIFTFLAAPFAHSENFFLHEDYLLPEVQAHRLATENHYHTIDAPHASELNSGTPLAASFNTFEFARLVRAWVPVDATFLETVFWWCRVLEAHTPIIRVFGRYPYRNRAMGRDIPYIPEEARTANTPDEEQYLKDTNSFGVTVDEDAAKKIKDDIEHGVWTSLEQGESYKSSDKKQNE